MAEIVVPNDKLLELRRKLSQAKTVAERTRIAEEITALESTLMSEPSGAAAIEAAKGGISPAVATPESFKGKTILSPSMTEGIYRATKYDPVTGAATDLSQTDTGVTQFGAQASDKKLVYYDAQGKPISSSALAQTQEGKNMAAAGYDIGYGAGKIGPGAADYATGYRAPGTTDYNVMMGLDPLTGQPVEEVIAGRAKYTDPRSGRVVTTDASGKLVFADGTPYTTVDVNGNIATGQTLAKDVFKATMALYFGQAELSKGWMDELYNVVSKFYRNGVDVPTAFNMALLEGRSNPNLKAFTDRFKGIYALQDLRQAGKPVEVPTIAQYVASQTGMADLLKQANLDDLATEEFTGELIGKGNSVTTIAEKIAKAYQRIDMAPKAIKDTFSRYYPTVDRPTLARTILLGQKGVDELVDELSKFEVLAAAEQQGLGAITKKGGLTEERAMEYARAGGTYQSLLPKFGQIARALPDIQKLTGISRAADISQADVEKAVISQSEQELRRLEDISLQEEARFRAKAGRADIPLASQRRANRAF